MIVASRVVIPVISLHIKVEAPGAHLIVFIPLHLRLDQSPRLHLVSSEFQIIAGYVCLISNAGPTACPRLQPDLLELNGAYEQHPACNQTSPEFTRLPLILTYNMSIKDLLDKFPNREI